MTKKQLVTPTLIGIVWTLAFTALVAAQQPATPGEQQSQQHGGDMRSMDDMMQECRTHCQATGTAIDQLMAKIDEAKQSNDPAQMRAALEEAQKPLAGMKDHMRMCQHMMSMMHRMHGGMGGHMEGSHMGGMMRERGPQSGTESR